MKALTVRQPWAWALVMGYKGVENRTTLWKHRGLLLVHASGTPDPWPDGMENPLVQQAIRHALAFEGPEADVLFRARGSIIGAVTVTDTHRATVPSGCCPEGWAEPGDGKKVHMVVEDAVRFPEPIPAVGALGLWDVPDDVEAAVRERLPRYPRAVG